MATDDNDKLLEALFPEEWYKKVTQAIEFAIHRLGCDNMKAVDLAKYIIDYNIEMRLETALSESAELILPKSIDWSKMDVQSAFEAFNALLETCDLCKKLKNYKLEINFGTNNILYNEFLLWKEVLPNRFPRLVVKLDNTKTHGIYLLKVTKAKRNKSPAKG